MRSTWGLVAAIALGAALALFDARWHLPCAVVLALGARALDPALARGLGRARRWAAVLFVLALFGAWLGPPDHTVSGVRWSLAGALAAGSMMARSLAILLATSSLVALVRRARLGERLAHTRARRFGEVVTVALSLVPAIVTGLYARAGTLARPRSRRSFDEILELSAAVVLEATDTAHRIADEWGERATSTPSSTDVDDGNPG